MNKDTFRAIICLKSWLIVKKEELKRLAIAAAARKAIKDSGEEEEFTFYINESFRD